MSAAVYRMASSLLAHPSIRLSSFVNSRCYPANLLMTVSSGMIYR